MDFNIKIDKPKTKSNPLYKVQLLDKQGDKCFSASLPLDKPGEIKRFSRELEDNIGGSACEYQEAIGQQLGKTRSKQEDSSKTPATPAAKQEPKNPDKGRSAELLSADLGGHVEFPLDALPKTLREFVEKGTWAIHCQPEFLAIPLLVGMGAAIGRTHKIVTSQ